MVILDEDEGVLVSGLGEYGLGEGSFTSR